MNYKCKKCDQARDNFVIKLGPFKGHRICPATHRPFYGVCGRGKVVVEDMNENKGQEEFCFGL